MNTKTKNIIAWVAQGILSLMMLGAGAIKLTTPYDQLLNGDMPWVENFSPIQVQIIATLEILGVIGMNLPFLIKKFKVLVPIAAAALSFTMVGAVLTHITRGENFVPAVIPLLIAILVAYSRKDLLTNLDKELDVELS